MDSRFIYLVSIWLFFSCSDAVKKPEQILEKSELAKILADIELAQAAYKLNQTNSPIDLISLSDNIYLSHNTTKEAVDSSLLFYSKSPKEIDELYYQVLAILVQKQTNTR
ncbi:MAG: DUF4296 domain-containing protein [Flavobacteriales bacterium]|nr:DUF4296 domain-containing protein [Flavobacteriales bacterium]